MRDIAQSFFTPASQSNLTFINAANALTSFAPKQA